MNERMYLGTKETDKESETAVFPFAQRAQLTRISQRPPNLTDGGWELHCVARLFGSFQDSRWAQLIAVEDVGRDLFGDHVCTGTHSIISYRAPCSRLKGAIGEISRKNERGKFAYKLQPVGVLMLTLEFERRWRFGAWEYAYLGEGRGKQKHRPRALDAKGKHPKHFLSLLDSAAAHSRFFVPYTRALGSTTANLSFGLPILQVELGW